MSDTTTDLASLKAEVQALEARLAKLEPATPAPDPRQQAAADAARQEQAQRSGALDALKEDHVTEQGGLGLTISRSGKVIQNGQLWPDPPWPAEQLRARFAFLRRQDLTRRVRRAGPILSRAVAAAGQGVPVTWSTEMEALFGRFPGPDVVTALTRLVEKDEAELRELGPAPPATFGG